MKKHSIGSKLISTLLVLAMTLSILPVGVFAAKGETSNDAVSTGLTGNIDKSDTISLPVKILDYENDGMLFEFAENYAAKTAENFGSKFFQVTETINDIGNDFEDVSVSLKAENYVSYVRLKYKGTTTEKWLKEHSGIYISPNEKNVMGDKLTNINDIRYVTIVYRSNVESDNMYFAFGDDATEADTDGRYTGAMPFKNTGYDGEGSKANWTFAVYDLKYGTLANNWGSSHPLISDKPNYFYIGLPLDSSGEWMDLAHVAFFSDEACAVAFGEYALTDGSDRGDNRGFGLLRGSRYQGKAGDKDNGQGSAFHGIFKYKNTSLDYGNAVDTITQLSDFDGTNTKVEEAATNLGYKLLGEFQGIANLGLLESTIGANGLPVYKEEVVTYLACLLKHSLEIPERNDGWKNYRYVKGTPSSVYGNVDLATALRNAVDDKEISKGDYALAAGKNLIGKWADVNGNISTYHDAAYFLLNTLFVEGSYNTVEDDYDYLVLSSATDAKSGDKVYVFDGGFTSDEEGTSAVKYDSVNKTIQNSDASFKTQYSYSYSSKNGDSWTTLNPFLPVTDDNNEDGQTNNTYYQDDGVIQRVKKQEKGDTLYKRDFNFAVVSEGEFVYHADDELFFEFEGDDDVYLFINGELVLDLGSAHSIDYYRFNLNDYVNEAKAGGLGSPARNAALALEEGETYSFKFYYMERHSYGSNIRICTNIHVTDPSMTTAKPAWQDGVQLDFGSVVDKDKVVEYGFAITNNGEENLHNLTFKDNDIGVTLDPTNGLKVTGSRVYDVNGGTLTASDLTAVITHPDYDAIHVTFADNTALKTFLTGLTASGTEAGAGLYIGATVQIRGIGYTLTDAQINEGVFDNTVLTTSTNSTGSKTLQGQATMRVFVPADPMYYEWAGHALKVTKTELIEDVLAAANTEGNLLAGKVPSLTTGNVNKIELVTKAGNAISSPYVAIDSSNNLTINYPTAGSKVFYVKVTYNSSKNNVIVPVLVNVTAVQDRVIVLDYGLPVDITFENDALVVPGRVTKSEVLGFGTDGSYSPNEESLNEITFTSSNAKTFDGKYGTFKAYDDGKVTYTPTSFIEGADTIQIAYTVYESDITPSRITNKLDINNEVEMYKSITIVPANVMYYEDDFTGEGAITYTTDANIVNQNETDTDIDTVTNTGLIQSADQTMPYGYDPVYADGENVEVSGGSVHKILLDGSDDITFTFTGSGFELIGRTDAVTTGTIVVTDKDPNAAQQINDNGEAPEVQMEVEVVTTYPASASSAYSMSGETMFASTKIYPVIMEFDNGNDGGNEVIYQVPVIRIDGLDNYGTHQVTIRGIQAYNWSTGNGAVEDNKIDTYFYFDGLRIFQPLTDKVGNTYYNANEQSAQFHEIRDLILNGKVGVATREIMSDGVEEGTEQYKIASGNLVVTWTEDYEGKLETNQVNDIDDYLLKGPNNEVYMLDDETAGLDSALFFYVDKETVSDNAQVQIAVRALDYSAFIGSGNIQPYAKVQCSILDSNGNQAWKDLAVVESGTEQYYNIDFRSCPTDNNGNYFVALRLVADSGVSGMVSYSSLKLTGGAALYKGWTVKLDGTFINGIYDNGVSGDKLESSGNNNSVANLISAQLRSDLVVTGPVNKFPTAPGIPEIDDPFQNLPDNNPDDPKNPENDDDNNNEDNDEDNDEAHTSNFDLLKLFTLTAIAGEGGKITPEGDLVIAFGASRTFKFIPDEGYEIADVLVNGISVGAVEKYVLKAAHADTVVEVLFREIPEAAAEEEASAEEAAG